MWSLLALFTASSGPVPPLQLLAMTFTVGSVVGLLYWLKKPPSRDLLKQPAKGLACRDWRLVWLSFFLLYRPAKCPCGRSKPGRLSLAGIDCCFFCLSARREIPLVSRRWNAARVLRCFAADPVAQSGFPSCRHHYPWVSGCLCLRLHLVSLFGDFPDIQECIDRQRGPVLPCNRNSLLIAHLISGNNLLAAKHRSVAGNSGSGADAGGTCILCLGLCDEAWPHPAFGKRRLSCPGPVDDHSGSGRSR